MFSDRIQISWKGENKDSFVICLCHRFPSQKDKLLHFTFGVSSPLHICKFTISTSKNNGLPQCLCLNAFEQDKNNSTLGDENKLVHYTKQ